MMAAIPDFIRTISPIIGMHPATLTRYIRCLTHVRIVRKSRQGGGIGSVHLDHWEAASIILGLAASMPGGAAIAYRKLADLHCGLAFDDESSLLHRLAIAIYLRAFDLTARPDRGWKFTASVDPAYVKISWNLGDQCVEEVFTSRWLRPASDDVIASRAMKRETTFSHEIIHGMARLVADTMHNFDGIRSMAVDGRRKRSQVTANG